MPTKLAPRVLNGGLMGISIRARRGPVLGVGLIAAILVGLLSTPPRAAMAPPEVKESTYRLDQAAHALIDPMLPQQLGDDREFIRVLRDVLERPDFSTDARVDAFTLMLGKIGWLFNGTAPLPRGFSYPRMFQSQVGTFLGYQNALSSLGVDGTPLVAVPQQQCATDVIRCSSAILLCAIVARETLKPNLPQMLNAAWIRKSQVPSIALHALAQAAVLERDPATVPKLVTLLHSGFGEEEQEDLLSALAMYAVPESNAALKAFILGAAVKPYDQAMETALIVLRRREPPDQFAVFYDALLGNSEGAMAKALSALQDREFQDGFSTSGRGMWRKVWDGFSIVMYEDGMLVTKGDTFRAFEPNRPELGSPEPPVRPAEAIDT